MLLRKFFAVSAITLLTSSIISAKDASELIAAADLSVNLDGTWNYTNTLAGSPCQPPNSCQIVITGNTAKFISPIGTGLFLIDVYSTPNRGKPVIT